MINLHKFWLVIHSGWQAFYSQQFGEKLFEFVIYFGLAALVYAFTKTDTRDNYRRNTKKYTWWTVAKLFTISVLWPLSGMTVIIGLISYGIYLAVRALVAIKVKEGPPEWM